MEIQGILEYNENGALLWAENFPGAFSRGKNPVEAEAKLSAEVRRFLRWRDGIVPPEDFSVRVVQKKESVLEIQDADTDILFASERLSLTLEEYQTLKSLVLRSAEDFQQLYDAIPEKECTDLPERKTFYGSIPRTAEEMYRHANQVANYYIGELGAEFENLPDIRENRVLALKMAEQMPGFLENTVIEGSYSELWTLRKALRRFLWHDRIHVRALWRMARCVWGDVPDPFCFGER